MFRKAIVVDTHPEDHSVDLVMVDDGARLTGVPVLGLGASARSGHVDMPEVPKKGTNKWDITQRNGQDMEAVVGFFGKSNPVVVGFVYPQISQMTFKDSKRRFNRHQSDVYHTIDGNGNMELFHPSGTFVRIAETPGHENLERRNFDENMALDRNKNRRVHIHIEMAGAKAVLNISTDGAVSLSGQSASISVEQNISMTAGGTMSLQSGGNMTLKAPAIIGDTPNLNVPSGDVHASQVSLVHHKNTGVMAGPALSGPPATGD